MSYAFACGFCLYSFKRVTGDLCCKRTIQIARLPSWTCKDERTGAGDYLCGPDARHFTPKSKFRPQKDEAA